MRIGVIMLLLFCCSYSFGQQNLFNIPSGDITPKGKIFFQQQINSYSYQKYESKSHFVYGLRKKMDVGINFVNLPVTFFRGVQLSHQDGKGTSPLYPALLLTAQREIGISENVHINFGFVGGSNIPYKSTYMRPLYTLYGLANVHLSKRVRVLCGPYYSNKYLVGSQNNFGVMGGYEIILNKHIYLMGDYVSGRNSSSAAVIGVNLNVTKRFQLCFGGLLATPQEAIKPGVVFEINILGYDLTH